MVFSAVTKKKTFFSLHGSITTKSLLNSLLVLCVFVKMNLFLLDSVDKKIEKQNTVLNTDISPIYISKYQTFLCF